MQSIPRDTNDSLLRCCRCLFIHVMNPVKQTCRSAAQALCEPTLYWMASSTDMSALLFSAVSTAPPYTSRGTLLRICIHLESFSCALEHSAQLFLLSRSQRNMIGW